jgi:hypothetical protein
LAPAAILLAGASMLETLTDPQETGIRIGLALNVIDVMIDVTIRRRDPRLDPTS